MVMTIRRYITVAYRSLYRVTLRYANYLKTILRRIYDAMSYRPTHDVGYHFSGSE